MDFKTAAFTCLRLKYANFSDRAPRSEYWWFMLLSWICAVALGIILAIILALIENMVSSSAGETIMVVFVCIAVVTWIGLFLIPAIAVSVRRFHDIDMTGWWLLLFLALRVIPVVGAIAAIINIVLFCKQGTDGANRFGNNPFTVDDYQKTFQ